MSLFRSDRMGYYNILMPREYAWEVLNELGELDAIQFVDLNSNETAFNRPYSNHVKRAEDLEAKISSIEREMTRFDVPIERCDDPQLFLMSLKDFLHSRNNKADRTYFDDLEAELDDRVTNLSEQIRNYDNLIDNHNHLVEFRQVLLQTRPYIGDSEFRAQYAGEGAEAMASDNLARGNIRFSYLAGVINREDSLRFKRILFRVTRGMAWTTLLDISKPANIEKEGSNMSYFKEGVDVEVKEKTVFLIVYQGGALDMMKAKLNRVCDSFGASKYGIPEDPTAFNKKLVDIDGQLREAQNVINITQGQIKNILNWFSQPRVPKFGHSRIDDFRLFVLKEKSIYHNLNTLKAKNALYQGSCWCPVDIVHKVREALLNLKRRKSEIGGCEFKDAPFPKDQKAPTHFRLNDVSWAFQEIVNTYGIPRYREINPGLFAIATFPFLFGVMFGDIGHGALVFIFGAYLCLFKETLEKEKKGILYMALPARYLLLLQGLFAFYAGLIYNDFMAMPWNLFGTCYNHAEHGETYVTKTSYSCTYPIGIDPAWYGTTNELTFLNSFKMKTSIVLGVCQMLFGILLRGINNVHFDMWLEFFFEFLPMLIFMSVTFGYMVVLIFLKWAIPWNTDAYPTSQAPSIIGIFIKMALSPGSWDPSQGMPLYGDAEGKEQSELQYYFLITALICAVLILVPKPLILYLKHGGSSAPAGYAAQHDEPSINEKLLTEDKEEGQALKKAPAHHDAHGGHGDHFEFGEVFVHQVIETIEFVLGSISNTASYLRLWALSLAHSQLAKVFYDNTMGSAIISGNFIMAFAGFIFFAIVTFGVLILMDQMECFLHALRLHWVEFQSKFYKADGYAFEPFSFTKTLKAEPTTKE